MVKANYRVVEDIENCENCDENGLIPIATRSAEAIHLVPEKPREGDYRTFFAHDRDRIIHSIPFQHLVYKSQVFCGADPSKYTTRLLHTLKVAQIAQTISRALHLNEDLTVAIALGHDLGHTPFGHIGEDIFRERLINENGFEHNEEGVTLAIYFEGQLNLTAQTLEGILKHTKFNFQPYTTANVTRIDPFQTIRIKQPRGRDIIYSNKFKYMGPPDSEGKVSFQELPSYEAQVVDIADEIAYVVHDLEDCLAKGIITQEELPDEWHEEFADDPRNGINALVTGVIQENFTKLVSATRDEPKFELVHTEKLANLIVIMKQWYSDTFSKKLSSERDLAEKILKDVFDLFDHNHELLRQYIHPWYYKKIVTHPFRNKALIGHCLATLTDFDVINIYQSHLQISS